MLLLLKRLLLLLMKRVVLLQGLLCELLGWVCMSRPELLLDGLLEGMLLLLDL